MITGRTINKIFQVKYDAAYSGNLDIQKTNRLFRETLFLVTDRKYLTLEEQKIFDELTPQITTQNVFQVNNNRIFTAPVAIVNIVFNGVIATITTLYPHNLATGDIVTFSNVQSNPVLVPDINGAVSAATVTGTNTFTIPFIGIPVGTYTPSTGQITFNKLIADYMHLYSVKCKYQEPQIGLRVSSTSGLSPIVITFPYRTKFRDGSVIQLTSMSGTPAANGTWYYKHYTQTSGALYVNQDLTIPTTGGVTYNLSQGNVYYIWNNEAKPRFANRLIDPFEQPSPDDPQFETADKFLKFYPTNRTCSEITMSYFKIPTVFIDVNNDIIDLSLTYPERYIYFLIDVAIRLLSTPLRDILLNQSINQEISQNP